MPIFGGSAIQAGTTGGYGSSGSDGGSSMLPGLMEMIGDSISQNKEMTYNHYMYRKQEDRANDATQRHVRDLLAAGLNPMLAYGSAGAAATVPQGAPAPRAHPKNFASAGQADAQRKLLGGQLELIDAQKEQIRAMTAREGATAVQIAAETKRLLSLLPLEVRTRGGEAARKEFGKETLEGLSGKERSFYDALGSFGSMLGLKLHEFLHGPEGTQTIADRLKERGREAQRYIDERRK